MRRKSVYKEEEGVVNQATIVRQRGKETSFSTSHPISLSYKVCCCYYFSFLLCSSFLYKFICMIGGGNSTERNPIVFQSALIRISILFYWFCRVVMVCFFFKFYMWFCILQSFYSSQVFYVSWVYFMNANTYVCN